MRVLQVSAEIYPLLKTGGLADIAGALPHALIAAGQDVRVLLPGFPAIVAGVVGLVLDSLLPDLRGEAPSNTKASDKITIPNETTPPNGTTTPHP